MSKIKKSVFPSIILILFLYSSVRAIKRSPSLPSIKSLIESAANIFLSSEFYINLIGTIKIVLIGVAISFAVGFLIALICSASENLNYLIMPIINSTKNIPSIALFPLFIILMGIGDTPRIFVIIWNSMYPIISSSFAGFNSVPSETIEAAQNCGANKFQIYKYIKIPLSIFDLLNGLKIAVSNGFIAIVVAEMLGATKGLGYMVLWSANAFKYSDMYIYILVIALIGFSFNALIEKITCFLEGKMFYESKKNN